ncbi:MAG: GNAT family N-acetyltransferase [Pseudomonadota bacterium]
MSAPPTYASAPRLQTERLSLRPPRAQDAGAYRDFYADGAASAFYGGPLPEHRAWMRLAADIGHWSLRGFGVFALVHRGETVGGCGLHHPQGWPSHELTWWLAPGARGAGLAREASEAVLGWARDALGWTAVETHMKDDNLPARRLAERLGFALHRRETFPDGVARDVLRRPLGAVGGASA